MGRAMNRDTTYYPNKLWVDTETGVFGNAKSIVILDIDTWSNEDVFCWETMTDDERQDYARVIMEAGEQSAPLSEYMKQERAYQAGLR